MRSLLLACLLALPLGAWAQAPVPRGLVLASEAQQARVLPLLAEGRVFEARAAAAAATRLTPDDAGAWMLYGWSRRQAPRGLPGSYGLPLAEAAYGLALALEPETPDARCGGVWARLEQGDRVGARAAFTRLLSDDPSDACALAGARASAPRWTASGRVSLLGSVYDGDPSRSGGISLLGGARVGFADLLHLELTGRLLAVGLDIDGVKVTGTQAEVWGRVGIAHRGLGVEALLAAVNSSGDVRAASVVGVRGWGTFGVTLRGEAAVSTFDDGRALQAGIGVYAPVFSVLSVDAGLQVSGFAPQDGDATGPAAMVSAALLLTPTDTFSLRVAGRGGKAWSPVRFDGPAIWNTDGAQTAGAEVVVSGRLLPWLRVHGTWEVARLLDPTGTVSHTHVFGLGVTVETEGEMR